MLFTDDNHFRQGRAINIVLLLRRHLGNLAIVAVGIPLLAGVVFLLWPRDRSDDAFYRPGVTPSREECVLAKMKTYAKVDKLALQTIAAECELTVQSIEGHEVMRKAWEARQAARQAEPKPAPAPIAEEPPPESDRMRRVWR